MIKHFPQGVFSCAALFFAAFTLGADVGPKAPPPSETRHASLLATRWDFSDRSLRGWRWKDNAKVSLAKDGPPGTGSGQAGMPLLRLQSGFAPYNFTWVARHFEPRSMDGVAHVRFRVRGDASGHSLELHLGVPAPPDPSADGAPGRSLYYINSRQAIALDFAGWRDVSMDIARFDTPPGGLRDRDLAHVAFVEFTVHSRTGVNPSDIKPLDIALADIQFVGLSPDEIAAIERNREEHSRLVGELTAAVEPIEKRLSALRTEIDQAAAQGKYTDVARVYWTALDWTVHDLKRYATCDELKVVRQAGPILADLRKWLGDPQRVLGKITASPPQEDDRLDSGRNPHFKSVIDAIRPESRSERSWSKGQAGYRSIPDAWTFRRLGDDSFAEVWAMTRPKSPLRNHAMLLRNALNIFDTVAHQHADGDFNIDRTAVHGRDPNINRFCLAPAMDAWCELQQAYPDLLPHAVKADIEAGFQQLVAYQVRTFGLARNAVRPDARAPAYPNMDVHHILIMERAYELWHDPLYAKERDAYVERLASAVYPMGAFTYVNTQNECFVYHALDVVYAARYWKLTGDAKVLELLKKTAPYYPYNVEPAGMPEYYTDACWKHYWGGGDPTGPTVIAALCGDPLNQRVAETCGSIWGYGRGHMGAIAAEFWKPIPSKPLPDNYVIYDANVQGPRGRYGNWSFAGNGRDYGMGFQGKDTFVGCMVTDPKRRPLPLDAALQLVTSEVRLAQTSDHWNAGRCCSAQEKLSTTLGDDFGSLAVRYKVSRPQWHYKYDELLPWDGTEVWYLSRRRLIGLVALEATADETQAAVWGRVRLGLRRDLEPAPDLGPDAWRCGRLVVKLHGHNYARVEIRPSESTRFEQPSRYRSTELTLVDPLSVAASVAGGLARRSVEDKGLAAAQKGTVLFKKGTRYWFLVEVFPSDSPPAQAVQRIEQDSLAGFRFRDGDREAAVLVNPTEQRIETDLPVGDSGTRWSIYGDHSGKGRPADPGSRRVRLEPFRHVVAVATKPELPNSR